MSTEELKKNAHLYLGLTRKEFERRTALGEIDLELLKAQLEQNCREMELEVSCEQWLAEQAADQVDKFEAVEIAEN